MMKMRHLFTVCLSVLFLLAVSCTKSKLPTEFDIVGQWGVTTVTHVYPDMPSHYFEEIPGKYYSYWTFQVNGKMIEKAEPTGNTKYATYFYNANKRNLTYLYDGFNREIEAMVTIHNPVTITVTADLKEQGFTIYTMKKLSW